MHSDAATLHQLAKACMDIWGHPMAMNVPPWQRVSKKADALGGRKPCPERLRLRAQTVHD